MNDYSEGITHEEVKEKATKTFEQLISVLSIVTNFKYNLLIYRLLKRGHVSIDHLIQDTGLSNSGIRKIIDNTEIAIKAKKWEGGENI
jgi:hypothetical protein